MPIKKYLLKIIYYLLINFALWSIIGAFIYKFYKLNSLSIFLIIILSQTIIFIIPHFSKKFNIDLGKYLNFKEEKKEIFIFKKWTLKIFFQEHVFIFIYFLVFTKEILILINSGTKEAIISPWEVINPLFLFLYFILSFIIILNIFSKKKFSLVLIILHALLSFSVIAIIYKIGYGFDYFIHNTSLEYIKKNSTIKPKPFYYLGHYSLIIILNKITLIPINILNKFLIPILASLYLPLLLFRATEKWLKDKKIFLLVILSLLIIPYSFLTISNPQNLAYLYLIFAILIGFVSKNYLDLFLVYLFALASLSVHPIAGIPALFYALFISVYHSNSKFKKYFYKIIFILNSISLPLAFLLFNNNTDQINTSLESSEHNFNLIKNLLSFFKLTNPNYENVLLNFIYLYIFNLKFILILIIVFGIIVALKNKKECSLIFVNFFMSISLFISFFIIKNIRFNFLINYEQDDFSNRILTTAIIFLLPFFILSFYKFIEKLLEEDKIIQYSFLIILSITITFSLYASYPRLDNYYNSHGYSVSESDIKASAWINNDKNDYIVLANQQVSAAALSQFGFKKYFKNNIFYYPIPTGGELYQYYLKMVYKKPDRKTAEEAAQLTKVKTVYFVINKYWWASPKIIEEAKIEADSFQDIDNGNIYIFKYNF